jgi:hypothetical protein
MRKQEMKQIALIEATRKMADANPEIEFFMNQTQSVTGIKDSDTGEIVPVYASLLGGGYAHWTPHTVNSAPYNFTWTPLTAIFGNNDTPLMTNEDRIIVQA